MCDVPSAGWDKIRSKVNFNGSLEKYRSGCDSKSPVTAQKSVKATFPPYSLVSSGHSWIRIAVRCVIVATSAVRQRLYMLSQLKDEVEEVMQYMDEYYVSKDDWDTMVELGVGECSQDGVLKKIRGSTKAAFTKRFITAYFFSFLR